MHGGHTRMQARTAWVAYMHSQGRQHHPPASSHLLWQAGCTPSRRGGRECTRRRALSPSSPPARPQPITTTSSC